MSEPRLFRFIVPVRDMEQAKAFYSRVLENEGREVNGRHFFSCGDVILQCQNPADDGQEFRGPNNYNAYFMVDDLDSAFKRVKEAGPSWIEDAPAKRPWGERQFTCRDPFGNALCFVAADGALTMET